MTTERCTKIEASISKVENRLDTHIGEFKEHKSHFLSHERLETKRHNEFITAQNANTAAITMLVTKTGDMIDAWEAAHGALKVANAIAKLVKWIGGLGIAILAVAAMYNGEKP